MVVTVQATPQAATTSTSTKPLQRGKNIVDSRKHQRSKGEEANRSKRGKKTEAGVSARGRRRENSCCHWVPQPPTTVPAILWSAATSSTASVRHYHRLQASFPLPGLLPASLCMQFHSLHFNVQVNYNSLEQ